MLKKISEFSVFGNPICHTKSPYIHQLFSQQTGIIHNYDSTLVPLHQFEKFIVQFFLKKGIGANVTIPFKEEAFLISNKLTSYAKISKSVNTLKKLKNGKILGDNTDGKGILYDLKRLNFIRHSDTILVLGAGGAARGIIFSLLLYGCRVFVLNRTTSRSSILVHSLKSFGEIFVLQRKKIKNVFFDLVINAISHIETNFFWDSILFLVNEKTRFYDINYSVEKKTPFLIWCKNCGMSTFSDGIGMLVSQAAYSFFLWHNILPDVDSVILKLQKT